MRLHDFFPDKHRHRQRLLEPYTSAPHAPLIANAIYDIVLQRVRREDAGEINGIWCDIGQCVITQQGLAADVLGHIRYRQRIRTAITLGEKREVWIEDDDGPLPNAQGDPTRQPTRLTLVGCKEWCLRVLHRQPSATPSPVPAHMDIALAMWNATSNARIARGLKLREPVNALPPASVELDGFRQLLARIAEEGDAAAGVCDHVLAVLVSDATWQRDGLQWLSERAFSSGAWSNARNKSPFDGGSTVGTVAHFIALGGIPNQEPTKNQPSTSLLNAHAPSRPLETVVSASSPEPPDPGASGDRDLVTALDPAHQFELVRLDDPAYLQWRAERDAAAAATAAQRARGHPTTSAIGRRAARRA